MHGMSGTTYDDPKTGSTAAFSRSRRSNFSGRTTRCFRACSPIADLGKCELNVTIKGQAELADG